MRSACRSVCKCLPMAFEGFLLADEEAPYIDVGCSRGYSSSSPFFVISSADGAAYPRKHRNSASFLDCLESQLNLCRRTR